MTVAELRVLQDKKGNVLETEYSDPEILARLRDLPAYERNDFVKSLEASYSSCGWSKGQRYWAAKLVIRFEQEDPNERKTLPRVKIPGYANLARFFEEAKAARPQVTFVLSPTLTVHLSTRCGRKWPGCWNVSNGKSFGDPKNRWYGRVWPTGEFEIGPKHIDEVTDVLIQMAEDPAAFVAEYGR